MTLFDFVSKSILFLIPGLISHTIFSYLIGEKPLREASSICYVLVESSLACLIANICIWIGNRYFYATIPLIKVEAILSGTGVEMSTSGLTISIICAIGLGYILVGLYEKNAMFKVANTLKLSNRLDNKDVWTYLCDNHHWIIVRDYVSGNVYYGNIETYSDTGGRRELLLRDVSVFSLRDGEYKMDRVYLSRESSEFSVEIDDYRKEMDDGKNK